MNSIVLIKQVPDTETKITLKPDGSAVDSAPISKWVLNPYDEFAIEEAIRTKEKLKAGTVTVMTVGPDRAVEALRTALAMGADEAVHIKTDPGFTDSFMVSMALAEATKKRNPDVVFLGKQAIDDDQCAVFGMVAELLDMPSVSVVVSCEIDPAAKKVKVGREIEGGIREIIEMPLPCVVAVNKGINTPRYASLPGIMKAKKKEIAVHTPADLGLGSLTANIKESAYQLPPERKAGKKIEGDAAKQAKELVRLLREEAKVI